ncbi:collagen alpha-1(I) chain-like [Ischnura elegans]|uniref:collagen alpha-1(I) chain-like n=1 Tax=Ischnura elegans TaxID=197161 RepID=UPI001ED8AB1D|nr:collagen alpha-1(I) chain-like [Ischnura elegans]
MMEAILLLLFVLGATSLAEISPATTASTYIITTYRPRNIQKYHENLVASESLYARVQNPSPQPISPHPSDPSKQLEEPVLDQKEQPSNHPINFHKHSESESSRLVAAPGPRVQNRQDSYPAAGHNINRRQDHNSRPSSPKHDDQVGSQSYHGVPSPARQVYPRVKQNPGPPVNVGPRHSKPEPDGQQLSESSRHSISRRQDGPGVRRRPGQQGPPQPGGGPPQKEEPDYDDPNADRSYNFRFDTPVYSRREQADPKGEVSGRYTYVDDAGVRRVVDYLAGGRTGFYVRGSYPDPEIPGLSLFQASYGPGGRGPARARTSVHRGVDGSYRFDYGGPEHRRRESSDANGNVRGAYTYLDSAGRTRTVQYIAGPNIGFRVTSNTLGPPGPFVYPFPRPTIIPAAPTARPRPGGGPPTLRPSASTFPANPQAVPRPQETDFKDETLDNIPDLSSSGGGSFPQGASNPNTPIDNSPFPPEEELANTPQRGGETGQTLPDNNQNNYNSKDFEDVDSGDQSLPPPPATVNDRPFRRGEEAPDVNSFEVEDFDKASNDQDTSGQRGQGEFPVRDYDESSNGERGGARPGPFRGRIIGGRSVGEGPYGRKRRVKGRRSHRPIRKDGQHHRNYRREENSIPDHAPSASGGRESVPGIALVQSIDLGPAGPVAPAPAAALENRETFPSRRPSPPRVPTARRWNPSVRDTPA